jgi:hypothetical protein
VRNELIKQLMPIYFILGSLMVSACATPSPVSTEATLAPFEEPVESLGTPSKESPFAGEPEPSTAVDISFVNDVLPIFQSRCIVCHGGERRVFDLDLTSYSGLIAGTDRGPIIVPGDAANSLLVELVLAGLMPKRAPKLIPAQVQTLIEWINQGALDN